jgi:3-hydroxybutyryl-CoA dehydrogenase
MTLTSIPVCVIGAGTMGRGIAQIALAAGHRVSLVDLSADQRDAAREEIARRLDRRHPEIAGTLGERLSTFASIDQVPAVPNTLVVEAVLEELAVKASVFAQAEKHFGDDCILATNTSSLSITEIAASTGVPSRVVGMHFFNPVPLMRLVEVVTGLQTNAAVADTVAELAAAWGKDVARVRSAPGFIVNRVARAFYGEALRLVEEQAADPATIDETMRSAGLFKMGPFELMDLIGNDVNAAVTRTVWSAFNFDPRFNPSRIQDELVAAGRYGRKTGHGFYEYGESPTRSLAAVVEAGAPPVSVELRGTCSQLEKILERSGATVVRTPSEDPYTVLPDNTVLRVTRGLTARAEAKRVGTPVALLDRTVDPLLATGLAVAGSHDAAVAAAASVLGAAGIVAHPVDDVPGLVVARTLSLIANEAFETALQGIASPADIDLAMQLGTNYPAGPFEWTRRWGQESVLEILDALSDFYRDPRYRASRLLREPAARA